MKQKIANVIGFLVLSSLLILMSGAAGEPLSLAHEACIHGETAVNLP